MSGTTPHVLRRALRSLWENRSLNLVASGVIAAALMLAGVYLTVIVNLEGMVSSWERDVHVSAYFYADVPVDRRFAIKDDIARLTEVASVRYLSEEDARAYLGEKVPEVSPILDELGEGVLPASLEITLVDQFTGSQEVGTFAEQLKGPDFEEVDYGQEWVQRFNTFLSLLQALGVALGALILTASVFLVANAMHLVIYTRRAELETMKLVGATWAFISTPFLIEGALQGLFGAALAVAGVYGLHHFLLLRLQDYLHLALGSETLAFLPAGHLVGLAAAGVVLGVLGCLTAVRRFWGAAA